MYPLLHPPPPSTPSLLFSCFILVSCTYLYICMHILTIFWHISVCSCNLMQKKKCQFGLHCLVTGYIVVYIHVWVTITVHWLHEHKPSEFWQAVPLLPSTVLWFDDDGGHKGISCLWWSFKIKCCVLFTRYFNIHH